MITDNVVLGGIGLERTHLVRNRLVYTGIILFIYMICRRIPLNGIDFSSYAGTDFDIGSLVSMTINGSKETFYVMSLGISPYITSSILVQLVLAFFNSQTKSRMSPVLMNRIITGLSFVVALIQALIYANGLNYITDTMMYRMLAIFELMAGSFFVQWLVLKNKEHGIGGASAIILINMIDGLIMSVSHQTINALILPILISLMACVVMIFMENHEKRIPLQRVSIHSIYADKNYLAIKYNPIGIMPIMFASAVFMIPQLIFNGLCILFPDHMIFLYISQHMNMETNLGLFVYLVLLLLLTIVFSVIFVNPGQLSEDLLKSGDSIPNVYAGKMTKHYLYKIVLFYGTLSGIIFCICMGIPLVLQNMHLISGKLSMLPSTSMIFVGILCTLFQEYRAYKDFDSYKRFM